MTKSMNYAEFKDANQIAAGDTHNEIRIRLLDRTGMPVDLIGKTVLWSGWMDEHMLPFFGVGGRNFAINTHIPAILGVASNRYYPSTFDLNQLRNKEITVSADIEVVNKTGGTRLGSEFSVVYENAPRSYFGVFVTPEIGGSVKQRVSKTFKLLDQNITEFYRLSSHIQLTADSASISFPKIELGNKASVWTPAPEDLRVDNLPATVYTNGEIGIKMPAQLHPGNLYLQFSVAWSPTQNENFPANGDLFLRIT